MDKKTKKELERLERVTNTERNFLKGIYGDLFSSEKKPDKKNEKAPTAAELLNEAKREREKTTSHAYTDAETALKEVQDLIAGTDELIKSSLGNLGELTGGNASANPAESLNSEGLSKNGGEAGTENGAKAGTAAEADTKAEQQTEEKPAEPETDPMEDLEKLVGLSTIKHDVWELTAFVKMQKLRSESGLKSVPVSLHLVFTGNPGTGKTTVARIIARLYKQIGVLSKGQLIEVDRSGLVAGYVGQTALKTQDQIKKALGGVLFIDEAYALAQKDDAFGQEAIDTILKAMEDHRDDLVVIVAGYTKPMEKFINSNPGLKSRFNKYIEFPDYTVDELEQIFDMNCKKYDYVVEEEAKKQIRALIVSRQLGSYENFANAREVRNLFEEIITNQARRVAAIENPTNEDFMTIRLEDLSEDDKTVDMSEVMTNDDTENRSEEVVENRVEEKDNMQNTNM